MEIFKNRKSNTLKRKATDLPLKMSPILHLHGERTDGFHKFRVTHKDEISVSVNAERKKDNISHFMFLPMFQQRLSKMWQSLTPEEREGWNNFVVEESDDKTGAFEYVYLHSNKSMLTFATITATNPSSPPPYTPCLRAPKVSTNINAATALTFWFRHSGTVTATSRRKCMLCSPFFKTSVMKTLFPSVVVDGLGPGAESVRNQKTAFEKFVAYWEKRCEETIPYSTSAIIQSLLRLILFRTFSKPQ